MSKPLSVSLRLALPLVAVFAVRSSAQARSNAEERMRGFAEAFHDPDTAAMTRFVKDNFAKSFLAAVPLSMHTTVIGHMRVEYGGWNNLAIVSANDTVAVARLSYPATARTARLRIAVEKIPPYGIVDVNISAGPSGSVSPAGIQQDLLRTLDATLSHLAAVDSLSAAVLVASRDSVLFTGAYGFADRVFAVRNRVDTRFNVASMNKMFTAVAIAQLISSSKIRLDENVAAIAPGLLDERIAGRIQLRHLLSHTSGLGDYMSNPDWEGLNGGRLRTIDDYLKLVRRDTIAFTPGTRFSYSNSAFIVLGKIIELVSGESYYDYVTEHVFRPAGMLNTGFAHADSVTTNLATAYVRGSTAKGTVWSTALFMSPAHGGSAGGGYSTVQDLYRFASALERGTLVSPELLQTFMTPKPELSAPGYGFGFALADNGRAVGHSGGFPGTIANLDIFRRSGHIVVVLGNMTIGHSGAGASDIIGQLRGWVDAQSSSR